MGNKKIIIIAAAVALLVGGGTVGYSVISEKNSVDSFASTGYVLTADVNSEEKQILVDPSSSWKQTSIDSVSFKDVQGTKTTVSQNSFVHYDNGEVAALTDGVVVDLNAIQSGRVTNYYAVSSTVRMAQQGTTYSSVNGSTDLKMDEFLWKLSADKYLLCGKDLQVSLALDDIRDAGDYIEINYIDGDVVQIQTADNIWQTVSSNCFVTLNNGDVVDLYYRGVEDASGSVLMDFSKIVLNSEDNIEVTPINEDLMALQESTIPHFEVFTQDGKDGTAGTDGDDGSDGGSGGTGYTGNQGDPGQSGTDGAAGDPGAKGGKGAPGTSQYVEGTVLTYPVFNITNWKVTSTGCSGIVTVADKSGAMLDAVDNDDKYSCIQVIDMETNSPVRTLELTDHFGEGEVNNRNFEFTGLEPDHNYRLIVSAKINAGLGDADYVRDFISKTFWTDSVGLYMEDAGSSTSAVNIQVLKREYATDVTSYDVYLFSNYADAKAVTTDKQIGRIASSTENTILPSKITFNNGLSSNTTYYARLISKNAANTSLLLNQVLELKTLKTKATIGTPALSANRDSWAFELTPGAVYDPDKGIESYIYEFYGEGSVQNGKLLSDAVPVKTVKSDGTGALTVPIDGVQLSAETGFYVRTTAVFNDNEKVSYIYSELSNRGQVNGSKLPMVYFIESGSATTGLNQYSSAAEVSTYYDKLYGTLVVAPSADSARVLLDEENHPTVIIRAAGVYYASYPVYLDTDPNKPALKTTYLTGYTSGGYLYVELPAINLSNVRLSATSGSVSNKSAAVYGLKPHTQYQLVVVGNLSNDGSSVYEYDARVGSCVVETPDTYVTRAIWTDSTTLLSGQAFATTVRVNRSAEITDEQLDEQYQNVTSVKLTLSAGRIGNLTGDTYSVELTPENFKEKLGIAEDDPTIRTLGDAMVNGVTVSNETFDLATADIGSVSSVVIAVDTVADYTVLAKNRVNQKAYISNDADALTTPEAVAGQDGAVFVNKFSIDNNQHEIELAAAPDPIPDHEKGFSSVTKSKNEFSLVVNYPNTGKLAKNLTYYVFDAPDYYAEIENYLDSTVWKIKDAYGGGLMDYVRCGVTCVRESDNLGTELGSVTVNVPASGVMPKARFIPMTKEEYCEKNSIDPGTLMQNASGEYLMFLNEGSTEPETGHQYVFAWTMEYKVTENGETKYYPFDAGGTDLDSIPCSEVQDVPRTAPTIYAAPYDVNKDTANYGLIIEDPDGAIVKDDSNKTTLYKQTALVDGTILKDAIDSPVTTTIHETYDFTGGVNLFSGDNLVQISNSGRATGSVAASVRVQWYTDKYTLNGIGLFKDDGTPNAYLESTKENAKTYGILQANKKKVIAYYLNAFTFYYNSGNYVYAGELGTKPSDSITSVVVQEATPSQSSDNVNHYVIQLTGDRSEMDKINGYRVEFLVTKPNSSIVKAFTDKVVNTESWSYLSSDENTLEFEVYIGREIMDVAGVDGELTVNVYAIYETGENGILYLNASSISNPVSLFGYTFGSSTSSGYELKPSGWYKFSAAKSLQINTADERLGSFFTGSFSATADAKGTVSTKVNVASTRTTETVPLEKSAWVVNITKAGGLYDGSRSLEFRKTAQKKIDATTVFKDKNGKTILHPSVPAVTCTIEYTNDTASANNISSNFIIKGNPGELKFIVKNENGKILRYVPEEYLWTATDIPSSSVAHMTTAQINEIAQTVIPSEGEVEINYLEANTKYRLEAYYYVDGEWRILNMPQGNTEVNNNLIKTTTDEPHINLNVSYSTGNYSQKYIWVRPVITKVANYYYVMELMQVGQNDTYTHITYLNNGLASGIASYNDTANYYEFGRKQSIGGLSGTSTNWGLVRKDNGFDTTQHITSYLDTMINLELGGTYCVKAHIYEIGFGPMYEDDYDMDVDPKNMLHSDTEKKNAVRTFTVKYLEDTLLLQSVYSLEIDPNDETNLIPTITFTPRFQRNRNMMRNDMVAYMIVRERSVNDVMVKEDVSSYATVGSQEYSDSNRTNLSKNAMVAWTQTIHLSNASDPDLIQKGDVFTCYVYCIDDDISYGTKTATPEFTDFVPKSNTNLITLPTMMSTQWRTLIIAGRSINGVIPETTEAVNLTDGTTAISRLMISERKIAPEGKTSAGDVTITFYNNTFTLKLDAPVNITAIKSISYSIATEYQENPNDDLQTTTEIGDMTVSLRQVSTTIYEMDIPYAVPAVTGIQTVIINAEFVDEVGDIVYVTGTGGTTRTENGKKFGDSFDASLVKA